MDELFRSEIEAEDAANAEEGNGEQALEASASAAAPSQQRSLIAGWTQIWIFFHKTEI